MNNGLETCIPTRATNVSDLQGKINEYKHPRISFKHDKTNEILIDEGLTFITFYIFWSLSIC